MAASAPLPARRSGRGRRASTAIGGLLLVAAAGATAGWLVQRGSVAAIAAAAQAVVGIRVDFGGDRSGTALGLAVGPSGQIAVAYSSVNGAESIEVHVAGRAATLLASVAGLDPTDDLALLQLQNAPRLPAVSLGTPSPPFVGDSATAIGAPTGGGTPAVSEGSITGLDQTVITRDSRSDAFATLTGVIGFSGPLSSADDGGALISGSGQLVGMILAGSSQLWPARSISAGGVALPVRTLAAIAHDMETGTPNPRVLRAGTTVLGVDTQDNASPPGGRWSWPWSSCHQPRRPASHQATSSPASAGHGSPRRSSSRRS